MYTEVLGSIDGIAIFPIRDGRDEFAIAHSANGTELARADLHAPNVSDPTTAAKDTTAPSLSITSPMVTIVSTSAASLRVAGTASDNVGVASVKWTTSNGNGGTASVSTSWSADVPLPGLGAYSTAKYAVRGLSESLRMELAPEGIGVSCLWGG